MTLSQRLRELVKRLDGIGHGPAIANELDSIADETEGKVLVKPFVVLDVPSELWVAKIDHTSPGQYTALGDSPAEAIAALQTFCDAEGSAAHIEVSQAGGKLPDAVQVPREVYDVVLKRLDYTAKYICQHGDTHDAVVREHERLKMCAAAQEK